MATATFNNQAIQAKGGKLYVRATPASVVAVTTATIVKELFEEFFEDGDSRDEISAGIAPWCRLDASGFKASGKQKPIKVNPNDGPEFIIGYEPGGYTGEITLLDMDVQKMKDVLSATAAQVLTTVASVDNAGRDTLLGGGQRTVNDYMLLYRYPSREIPGEFRHILVIAANFDLDSSDGAQKSKAETFKVKFSGKNSGLLPDPTTAEDVIWIEDYVTDAKTA